MTASRYIASVSALLLVLLLALPGCGMGHPGFDTQGTIEGNTAALHAVRARGRAIGALVAAGNAHAVFVKFTPDMARQVPESAVRQVLASTLAQGHLAPLLGDSVRLAADGSHIYVADYPSRDRIVRLSIVFDPRGGITGMLLAPRAALPPDPYADYTTKTALRLPFAGTWWVFWGGEAEANNYHVIAPDQRHAYDFCAWKGGATHRGAGSQNADYWAWGRPILAPAEAIVVESVNTVPDNRPGVMNAQAPFGNHVILDFGDGEYAVLAHMRRGSVKVRSGDRVHAGQLLGLCGNSGNSSEPHLHMHLQDSSRLFDAQGLPLAFINYVADGHLTAHGQPVQGQFLRAAGAQNAAGAQK